MKVNDTTQIKDRINRIRTSINKNNFDAVIIFSNENRRYLSGFTGEDVNYDESAGLLLITEKNLILATDSRYKLQATKEAQLYSIYCYEKGLSTEFPEILRSAISSNACRVAVETSRITFELYSKIKKRIEESGLEVELLSADEILKNFRIIKDNDEVDLIRASLRIAEMSFLQLKKQIHLDMTEKEAAWILEKLIRENGGDSLSFPVITASGLNSALPHAIPGERKFQKNEPLLFDFGAKFNGYCSDISRTLIIGETFLMENTLFMEKLDNGVLNKTFKEVYDILFSAQSMAINAIKPGIKCNEIDKIAREYIDSSKFSGRFDHSLGHGVGLAIHEPPRLSKLDDTILQAGMVVTVEPGIYIPEWGGIRVENMVKVTENGAEVLNSIGCEPFLTNIN